MSWVAMILLSMDTTPELFRIGQGYIDIWIHQASGHWRTNPSEKAALLELEEGLRRLIKKRDGVEAARRSFMPASPMDRRTHPKSEDQEALFDTTQDFYLTYYATVSAFASFLSRFSNELRNNIPHRSNQKFLKWLREFALFPDISIPLLEEARQFRALLDHKASHQPYEWSTAGVEGWIRIILHGPAGQNGAIPEGAMNELAGLDRLPEGHTWTFVAPDEDQVLSALALQLNAFMPRLSGFRHDDHLTRSCRWEPISHPDDPAGGYPTFAIESGIVTFSGPAAEAPPMQHSIAKKKLKPAEIDKILSKYFED